VGEVAPSGRDPLLAVRELSHTMALQLMKEQLFVLVHLEIWQSLQHLLALVFHHLE